MLSQLHVRVGWVTLAGWHRGRRSGGDDHPLVAAEVGEADTGEGLVGDAAAAVETKFAQQDGPPEGGRVDVVGCREDRARDGRVGDRAGLIGPEEVDSQLALRPVVSRVEDRSAPAVAEGERGAVGLGQVGSAGSRGRRRRR